MTDSTTTTHLNLHKILTVLVKCCSSCAAHRTSTEKVKIKNQEGKKRAVHTPPDHNWEFQRPTENQEEKHLSCIVSPHCVEVTRRHQTIPGHCRAPFQVSALLPPSFVAIRRISWPLVVTRSHHSSPHVDTHSTPLRGGTEQI